MNKTISLSKNLFGFALPLSLLGVLVILMRSSLMSDHNHLDLAITIDLLLTIPLVYFLLIRRTSIPKTTVVPVMVIGMFLGIYFLPEENQTYLKLFKTWALPLIEFLVIGFVIYKVRRGIKTYRAQKGTTPDVFDALLLTSREILPSRVAGPFATELAVIYYGFIRWRKRTLNAGEFSYHKNSGTPALLGAALFVIAIETTTFHILLERWSIYAAWIFSGLSIYSGLQVFGITKSLMQRPISIHEDSLILRYGIMSQVQIPLNQIEALELSQQSLKEDKLWCTLSPLGEAESHNLILHLKEEHTLSGLYGIKKKFQVIAFHLDEPKVFKQQLEQVCGSLEIKNTEKA
ncbi:hypothetical protein KFE98_01720 [bacterium SCSIO 12741]|nr:hypothetical protein KFE98_01720 [bacterium SCSIO 12741]